MFRRAQTLFSPIARAAVAFIAAVTAFGAAGGAGLAEARDPAKSEDKPWCAPEVTELEDHVCFADGGATPSGRRTLVVYLHGMLAATPGFQYVQQRMMAKQATSLHFTLLLPTSPRTDSGYWWPSGAAHTDAQRSAEADVVAGIVREKAALEARLGVRFDETFVVGFSSGAYYASSLVLRGALDVDGYVVLAGGSSWMRAAGADTRRVPVFVGVSSADGQTAAHSRAFAGTLAALHWPYRVEERQVGHEVDGVFLAHGLGWLRGRARAGADAR